MQRCKEMTKGVYYVPSESNANKVYTVTAFNGKPPTCTCPAFAIGRNRAKSTKASSKPGKAWCKHCDWVFDHICLWTSESDEPQREPGVCPLCQGPTVWDGDDDDDASDEVSKEAAITSLQTMIDDMERRG